MKADIRAIFIDKFSRLMNVLSSISSLPSLKLIVYFDSLNPLEYDKISQFKSQIEIISLAELMVIYSCFKFIFYININDLKKEIGGKNPIQPKVYNLFFFCLN